MVIQAISNAFSPPSDPAPTNPPPEAPTAGGAGGANETTPGETNQSQGSNNASQTAQANASSRSAVTRSSGGEVSNDRLKELLDKIEGLNQEVLSLREQLYGNGGKTGEKYLYIRGSAALSMLNGTYGNNSALGGEFYGNGSDVFARSAYVRAATFSG